MPLSLCRAKRDRCGRTVLIQVQHPVTENVLVAALHSAQLALPVAAEVRGDSVVGNTHFR